MPNIRENWTELTGEIIAINNDSEDSLTILVVRVSKSEDYKDFPNLITLPPNKQLAIKVGNAVISGLSLKPGDTITGRVRAAGMDQYFFNPEGIVAS